MTRHDDPPAKSGETNPDSTKRQRIAKVMARAGLCSRRDAEAWIVDGRVSVNGAILTSPAIDVDEDDTILVDGEPLPAADKTRLFLFHKPRGLVTSDHDPEGRATVADYLREHWPDGPRVVTIGRLDINTEGLLLLTNDGGLARVLELPATGWVRRYRVRAKGEANPADLEALAHGVTIEGVDYAGIEAKLDRVQGANCWLTMGLREGKNREVKRVLEHIGLEVNRLIRLSFGPFQLLELPEGAVEEVRTRVLRDQLGENLAAQAGVDFGDSEVVKAPPREERPARDARKGDRPTADRGRAPAERGARPPAGARPSRPSSGDRPLRARPDRRDEHDEAPPPQRERPAAGTRKHVSTLRTAGSEEARKGPRKRIERTDTHDRRDRTVKVERLVAARPAPERPATRVRRGADPSLRDPNTRFPRGEAPARGERAGARGDRTSRSETRSRDSRGPEPRELETRGPGSRAPASRTPESRTPGSRPQKKDFGKGPPRRAAPDGSLRPARPAFGDRRRDEARPARREERPDPRHGDGASAPRRHASPSALGKRERMSRSGGAPERAPSYKDSRSFSANKERRQSEASEGGRPADAEQRVRAPRPDRDSRPAAAPRDDRGPDRRPSRPKGEGRDGRRPDADRTPRARPAGDDRRGPRRDDKGPGGRALGGRAPGGRAAGGSRSSGERPSGAASRKPNSRKPGAGAGAPRSSGPRSGPGGKPPRGPSKPKR